MQTVVIVIHLMIVLTMVGARAAAEVGRRRPRHRRARRRRIPVEPRDRQRADPHHRDPGRGLLRHQPDAVDPGAACDRKPTLDHHGSTPGAADPGRRAAVPGGQGGGVLDTLRRPSSRSRRRPARRCRGRSSSFEGPGDRPFAFGEVDT